ncbi:MAG: HAMP domain-containing histidine kinase [Bacteroidetes bacterium]|nr:HAMP domain-containing histidine kinase [Bacteroidota bacterium]
MNPLVRRNKLFLAVFALIVLIIGAQLTWWVFFHINSSRTWHDQSLRMADQQRFTASFRLNQLWSDFPGSTTMDMTAARIEVTPQGFRLVSGDSSGFGAIRQNLKPEGNRYIRTGWWIVTSGENGPVTYIRLDSMRLAYWLDQTYPALRLGMVRNQIYDGVLHADDLVVNPDYLHAIEETFYSKNRMFLAEGTFFIILLTVAVVILYLSLSKEWRYTHQSQNFMLTVTHELKSPLAGARLNLETVLKHNPPPDRRDVFLRQALSELDRLTAHVDNILAAARLENHQATPAMTELNLTELIEKWFSEPAGGFDRVQFGDGIRQDAWVSGDEVRLRSVFINLVDNALKYSDGPVFIDARQDEAEWEFSVTDQGAGIPEDALPYIFDKFFRVEDEQTRQSPGAGLGLYIAREMVKLHRGTLTVESEPGKRTCFRVRLPKLSEADHD